MPRPITAVIHRQALQNNLAVVRKAMPNSKVFAVVKPMLMDTELNVFMKRLKRQMALPYLILMKQNAFVL